MMGNWSDLWRKRLIARFMGRVAWFVQLLAAFLLSLIGSFANSSPQTFWIQDQGFYGQSVAEACQKQVSFLASDPSHVFHSCIYVGSNIWATDPSKGSCNFVGGPGVCNTSLISYVTWKCIGVENRSTLSCACPAGTFFDASADNGGLSYDARGNCVPQCPYGTASDNGVCKRPGDDPGNNGGCPPGGCKVGNPINPGAGIKFERIPLYRGNGPYPLQLDLFYNSRSISSVTPPLRNLPTGNFGSAWIADHMRYLVAASTAPGVVPPSAKVQHPDGKLLTFSRVGSTNEYTSAIPAFPHKLTRLIENNIFVGWRYTNNATDETEFYDPYGSFMTMANRQGLAQSIGYADGQGGIYYAANSPTASQPRPAAYGAPECTPPSPGWHLANGGTPTAGRVLCMSDPFGRQLNFRYDAQGRIIAVADPAGHPIEFEYDGETAERWNGTSDPLPNLLTRINGGDFAVRTLHYNERAHINNNVSCPLPLTRGLPEQLTGTSDSFGDRVRTWTYDCQGRATGSDKGDGSFDKSTLAHDTPAPGQVTLTEETAGGNTTRVLNFTTLNGIVRATGTTAPCIDCGPSASIGYDANGHVASRIDWNGNLTCYTTDSRGRETKKVEGLGGTTCPGTTKPETRTITTAWHADWRLPTQVAEPLLITTYVYGAANATNPGERGNLLSRTEQPTTDATGAAGFGAVNGGVARTSTFSYDATGQVLTANGSRTDVADVTTFAYHAVNDPDLGKRANPATVTNALTHVTTYGAYNAHGQPTEVTDANNVVTQYAFDTRQRLLSRTRAGEVDSQQYDANGQISDTTAATGAQMSYTYAPGGPRIETLDGAGNRTVFTLDKRANRVLEETFDANGVLVARRGFGYDYLNRPTQQIGALGQTTTTVYDLQGNPLSVTDPLGRTTAHTYDALHRLRTTTQPPPAAGQPAPVTTYNYNGQGRLTQVTDARGLSTTYTVNGFGEVTQEVSPDRGTTTQSFDSGGNLLTRTDARGNAGTRSYDALNRLTAVSYGTNDSSNVTYSYDAGTYGKGRMTGMGSFYSATQLPEQVTDWVHDYAGRVTGQSLRIPNLAPVQVARYGYDAQGRHTSTSYPSGRTIGYTHDALGRVSAVNVDGVSLISNVTWHSTGAVKGWTWFNGRTESRPIDTDGRINSHRLGTVPRNLTYDAASRIVQIVDGTPASQVSFGYDALDRVTSYVTATSSQGYAYDATGNRTQTTINGTPYAHVIAATSNRVLSSAGPGGAITFGYDAAGTVVADWRGGVLASRSDGRYLNYGSSALTYWHNKYDALGRMQSANFLGGSESWEYDEANRVLRHYDANSWNQAPTQEFVYLGDMPIGVLNGQEVFVSSMLYSGPGFATQGTWSTVGSLFNSYRIHIPATNSDTATWTPTLGVSSPYRVYAGWVSGPDRAADATYRVTHAGGTTNVSVDQRQRGDEWVLLGTFNMAPGQGHRVQLGVSPSGAVVARDVRFVQSGSATLHAVHTDHLSTPRAVTNSAGTVVWRWDSEPFGNGAANQDPDGNGVTFRLGLRFPGQFFLSGRGLHSNYFRDYNPRLGRYYQSDPIGLAGGINTYTYVDGNPVSRIDPFGLQATPGQRNYQYGPITNSISIFADRRNDMIAANTIGADKYFHCVANCEASRQGPVGVGMSVMLSEVREISDSFLNKFVRKKPNDCVPPARLLDFN